MDKIAVIMSIYQNDKLDFVQAAIQSLLVQTYKSIDVFILFDGSVKSEVEKEVASLNGVCIQLFRREENKGLAFSLNELLRIVLQKDYQYVARMDADDISMPERFEKQIAFMQQHLDIDCLGTWAIEINSIGKEFFRKKMPITHNECFELFKKRDCMIHPTVMFRRSYFDKAGLYPEDTYFGEDTMMWAEGFKNGCQFANFPEYLLRFRLDADFFERRRGWKHAKSILLLRRRVNKMLGFGLKANFYAMLYAVAKLMPTKILNIIYRRVR